MDTLHFGNEQNRETKWKAPEVYNALALTKVHLMYIMCTQCDYPLKLY